jgi:hypothetical protein
MTIKLTLCVVATPIIIALILAGMVVFSVE